MYGRLRRREYREAAADCTCDVELRIIAKSCVNVLSHPETLERHMTAGMGRNPHRLADERLEILLPGQAQLNVKTVTDFWPSGLNVAALDSLKSGHSKQCYFTRLCGLHRAKLAPKSLVHNFRKHTGSSLDCKACKMYNCAKGADAACSPSAYETAAYLALSSLPADLNIGAADMLIDYRFQLSFSPILAST